MAHDSKYKPKKYERGERKRKFDPEKHCGRPANDGNPCTLAMGVGTDHVGIGACKHHGGNSPVSVYTALKRDATVKAIRHVRDTVEDPMDLRPELELLRAMVLEFVDRYEDFKEGLITFQKSFNESVTVLLTSNSPLDWQKAIAALRSAVNQRPVTVIDVSFASVIVDRVGKMVERIHKIKTDAALSPEAVRAYRDALVLAVMEECTPDQAKKIAERLERL